MSILIGADDKAGRLLITSRNRIATKYCPYVHEMKLLDTKQSWELLLKKALIENSESKFPEELETIGREILRKCDGLPLAINIVGGLLVDKSPSRRRWEKVLREINSHLLESGSTVSTILELSYRNLSLQLKSCFLCLGFFKEDSTIPTEKLVQVWIAHGLIPQESTMEETGRSYLDDLINRNMVQIKDMSKDEQLVKSCHIHDLIREMCITKAKEEIRFQILTKEGNPDPFLKNPRHCAVYHINRDTIYLATRNKYLHSLFFHQAVSVYRNDLNPSHWKSFVLLKVLDFEDFKLGNVPDTIGTITSLRYLGLRNTGIKEVPRSLGRLKTLEVLDLAKNRISRVPNFIWQIDSLRHLYISYAELELESNEHHVKMGTSKNLQTLNRISIHIGTMFFITRLTQMTNLRKLGLTLDGYPNSHFGELCTSLAVLKNLDCLTLRSFNYNLKHMHGLGILHSITRLRLWGFLDIGSMTDISFPPNISSLTIIAMDGYDYEDPMPVLEKLPKLLYLRLSGYDRLGEMVISHDGFPTLKTLSLLTMRYLENIQVRNGGMPELKRLEIDRCPKLEIHNIPQQLRSITNIF